jgi:hypothetical protein
MPCWPIDGWLVATSVSQGTFEGIIGRKSFFNPVDAARNFWQRDCGVIRCITGDVAISRRRPYLLQQNSFAVAVSH